MADSIADRACPDCGWPLPADAPGGLCPACLLRHALAPADAADSAPPTEAFTPGPDPAPKARADAGSGRVRIRYVGDYELIEEVGRGGMGVVYRAVQLTLRRTVALKMIRSDLLAGDDEVRRFHLEAEAAANLDHPNIVPIFEVGAHDGRHYFSMKFIEGRTLADPDASAPLRDDPARAAGLVATVARAVEHSHRRGILHRDLKPSNVLIDAEGTPYVTDFGLAKRLDGDANLTASQALLGTPAFMAPEQLSPRLGRTTVATDVYGLGALLYHLVTGQAPHRGESLADIIKDVQDRDPVPPSRQNPRVSRDLESIALKCLARDPARRYASAAEVADDLDRVVAGGRAQARRHRRPGRRLAAMAAMIGLLVLLSLAASRIVPWLAGRVPDPIVALSIPLPASIPQPVQSLGDAARIDPDLRPFDPLESFPDQLWRSLDASEAFRSGRPVLVYLAAAGGSRLDAQGSLQAYLLTPGTGPGRAVEEVSLRQIITELKEWTKKAPILLVLDVGQVDSDRDLGIFGLDPTDLLIDGRGGFAVLLACAPGQRSWVAEGRGTSVFAHYLAEALEEVRREGGTISAAELRERVASRVAAWVRQHRGGAIQTPVLLGDGGIRLRLPAARGSSVGSGIAPERAKEFDERLKAEWEAHHALAAADPPPYRHDPIGWRRYESGLISAERLMSSGDLDAARHALLMAEGLRDEVERGRLGPSLAAPWSLTLAARPGAVDPPADPAGFDAQLEALLARAGPDATPPPAPAVRAYAEGQVPAWYAEFAARGGESPALRGERLRLIRRAVEVRKLAERAAALDDRVVGQVRPLVDEADALRRQAQDRIFALDATAFGGEPSCDDLLQQAEGRYERAYKLGVSLRDALDLVERISDLLPPYGDFLARRPGGPGQAGGEFLEIAEKAAALDELACCDLPSNGRLDEHHDGLAIGTAELHHRFRRFTDRVDAAVADLAGIRTWQEADATLYLPGLPVEGRMALLRRLAAGDFTPPLDDPASPAPDVPRADPAVAARAIDLAEFEVALLGLAGGRTVGAKPLIDQARANAPDPGQAFRTLARFAAEVRDARLALIRAGIPTTTVEPGSREDLACRRLARAARVLPPAVLGLLPLGEDPFRQVEALDRSALVLWHAERLADDLDLIAAGRVLTLGRPSESPEAYRSGPLARDRVAQRINLRAVARIDVVPDRDSGTIAFRPTGGLPPGMAVAFRATGPDGRPSPRFPGAPDPSGLFGTGNPGSLIVKEIGPDARPIAFFRGQCFAPAWYGDGPDVGWVTASIHEATTSATIAGRKLTWQDQFEKHPGKGYLHPVNSLTYRLRLQNTYDTPLDVCVRYGLEDVPEDRRKVVRRKLQPGQVVDDIFGDVTPNDLELGAPKSLVVEITEGRPGGRKLGAPLDVTFTMIEPKHNREIGTLVWFNNGTLGFEVSRSAQDPVTAPSLSVVNVEPLEGARQVKYPFNFLLPGESRLYAYQIFPTTENLQLILRIDEIEVWSQEVKIRDLPKAQKPVPVPVPVRPAPGE